MAKKAAPKKSSKKPAPKKPVSKKPAAKKAAVKKPASKKPVGKKPVGKKTVAKKAVKKVAPKPSASKKAALKKTAPKKAAGKTSAGKKVAKALGAVVAMGAAAAVVKSSSKLPVLKTAAKAGSKAAPKSGDLSKLISPLDDRILIEVAEAATRTAGGLFIPDSVEQSDRQKQGKVVAVGRGHIDRKGKLHPLDVQLGDTVIFDSYMGSPLDLNGREVLVLRESQLLGVLKG